MQRLQDDPLQRTIETVMPLDQLNEDDKVLHVPSFVPATVDKVCGIISRQPGIDALRLGRQVPPAPPPPHPPSIWTCDQHPWASACGIWVCLHLEVSRFFVQPVWQVSLSS